MIPNLPVFISLVSGITTLITLLCFYWAASNSQNAQTQKQAIVLVILLSIWLFIQAWLTLGQFYNTKLNIMPPRLILYGILPSVLLILYLFNTVSGLEFIDNLPLKHITYLNSVRIIVEIGLFRLYLSGAVPKLMTFEGGNLDIISGLTAPLIAYFGFAKMILNRKIILAWNIICLCLLLNILVRALLSAPFPFQQFAFDEPNIAILNFPFVWIPTFIVPMVLYGHLVSIRQLLAKSKIMPD